MTSAPCQRWRERKATYRYIGRDFRPSEYQVEKIHRDWAKEFVERHHYSGTFVAQRYSYGLFRHDQLSGVAAFSVPVHNAVLTKVFPGDPNTSVELGRFVLLDEVPGNAESWFLARCLELLPDKIRGVVSFSDDVPRTTAAGETVFGGHLGTIYAASNAVHLGRGSPGTLLLLPDGTSFNRTLIAKIKKQRTGWRYASEKLVRFGADPLEGDPTEWLAHWLPKLTRPLRHPGCLKYAFGLNRREKRRLPVSLPYPKQKFALRAA